MGVLLAQVATSSAAWLTPVKAWPGAAPAIGLISLPLCAYLCWLWWHTPTGWLTWDPGVVTDSLPDPSATGVESGGWWWTVAQGSQPIAVSAPVVVVEWGAHLGLRFPALRIPPERLLQKLFGMGVLHPGWLWVDARMQPERWLPLRRALLASQRP